MRWRSELDNLLALLFLVVCAGLLLWLIVLPLFGLL